MIDDAIVVLENIFRFIEEKNYRPFHAAIAATKEIGLAVLATTLSLMAVFLPVAFMGGIVGRFLSASASRWPPRCVDMIVSFTLTPMISARWFTAAEPDNPREANDESKNGLRKPLWPSFMSGSRADIWCCWVLGFSP